MVKQNQQTGVHVAEGWLFCSVSRYKKKLNKNLEVQEEPINMIQELSSEPGTAEGVGSVVAILLNFGSKGLT